MSISICFYCVGAALLSGFKSSIKHKRQALVPEQAFRSGGTLWKTGWKSTSQVRSGDRKSINNPPSLKGSRLNLISHCKIQAVFITLFIMPVLSCHLMKGQKGWWNTFYYEKQHYEKQHFIPKVPITKYLHLLAKWIRTIELNNIISLLLTVTQWNICLYNYGREQCHGISSLQDVLMLWWKIHISQKPQNIVCRYLVAKLRQI